jgi:hypothetical protein
LTAFARFAQRTGVFALVLVALVVSCSLVHLSAWLSCAPPCTISRASMVCVSVGPKIEIFQFTFSAQTSPLTAFLEQSCTHTCVWAT